MMKSIPNWANIEQSVRNGFESSPTRARGRPPRDTDDFLIIAEKIKLLNKCISSFQKAKEDRDVEDYEVLCEALSSVKFLTDYATPGSNVNDFLKQCADMMQFHTFSKDSAIFHYGQPADRLYMILKGSVVIYVPKSPEQLEHERLQSLQTRLGGEELHVQTGNLLSIKTSSDTQRGSRFQNDNTNETQSSQKRFLLSEAGRTGMEKLKAKASAVMTTSSVARDFQSGQDYDLFSSFVDQKNVYFDIHGRAKMKRLRILGPGNIFGELALSTNKPRSASVIAAEDISVVSLSKENFKIVFDLAIRAMKTKMEYFCNFFDQCAYDTVSRFAYIFQEKKYGFGHVLYQQGDPPNGVFMVKEGEVQLSVQKPETPSNASNPRAQLSFISSLNRLNQNNKELKPVYKNVKISIMSAGSMIGCEEVLEETPRKATAVIQCDTIVYWAPTEEVRDLMVRHNEFREKMEEYHQIKAEYNSKRINEIRNTRNQLRAADKGSNDSGGFKLREEILESLLEECDSENLSQRGHERDSSLTSQRRDRSRDDKGLDLFDHKPKQHSLYSRVLRSHDFSQQPEKYIASSDSLRTFRTNTELPEDSVQGYRSHPPLLISPSANPLESPLLSPGNPDNQSRKKAIRGTTSKDYNNEVKLMLHESPSKLTIDQRTQNNLVIAQNTKLHSLGEPSDRLPFDFHEEKQFTKRSITSHMSPRKVFPPKLSSDNPQKPYENKAVISAIRNIRSPPSRLNSAANFSSSNNRLTPSSSRHGSEINTFDSSSRQAFPNATTRGKFFKGKKPERKSSFARQQLPLINDAGSLEICGNGLANQPNDLDSAGTMTAREMDFLTDNRIRERARNTPFTLESKTLNNTMDSCEEITMKDLANLELAAPWAKKKGNLVLNMHSIKPCYFLDVDLEIQTKSAGASTKHADVKDRPSPVFPNPTLMSTNSSNWTSLPDPTRKSNLRSNLISSKHNLFRLKPSRQYIRDMNYEVKNHVITARTKY